MFSKLRPNHHKRSASDTPQSPNTLQTTGFLHPLPNSSHGPPPPNSSHGLPSSAHSPASVESPSTFFFNRVPESQGIGGLNPTGYQKTESPVSPFPPTLPPIPRVASVREEQRDGRGHVESQSRYEGRVERQGSNAAIEQTSRDERRGDRSYSFERRHESRPSQESVEERTLSRRPLTPGSSTGYRNIGHSTSQQAESLRNAESQASSYVKNSMSLNTDFDPNAGCRNTGQKASKQTEYLRSLDSQASPYTRNWQPESLKSPGSQASSYSRSQQAESVRSPESQASSYVKSPESQASYHVKSPLTSLNTGYKPTTGYGPRRNQDRIPSPIQLHESVPTRSGPHPFGTRDVVNTSRPHAGSIPPQRVERHGKTKLHLLNPMSLLMRRRNPQALEQLAEESLVSHKSGIGTHMPDNYDPSIRGKVIHDFSAPRTRRNFSGSIPAQAEGTESRDSSSREGDQSMKRRSNDAREHAPVFKEHFGEEVDQTKADAAIRAETLADKGFLARNSFPPPSVDSPPTLPPFARVAKTVYKPQEVQPPTRLPPPVPPKDISPIYPFTLGGTAPLSPLLEDPVSPVEDTSLQDNASIRTVSAVSVKKPPRPGSRVTSKGSFTSDFQPAGLPSHMLSRASRFSFQYANTDSAAQERLLEERHKEKAAAARTKALDNLNKEAEEDQSEEEEDEFEYDDDMDGYEEDVPMVGEEWDYGGGSMGNLPMNNLTMGMSNLTMQQAAQLQLALRGNPVGPMQFSNIPVQGLGILPSIDDEGMEESDDNVPPSNISNMNLVDFNKPVPSIFNEQSASNSQSQPVDTSEYDVSPVDSLNDGLPPGSFNKIPSFKERRKPKGVPAKEDDFYFDDGEFDGADFDDSAKFDESVLDDPSHPLFERQQALPPPIPAKSTRRLGPRTTQKASADRAPRLSSLEQAGELQAQHPDPGASIETVNAYGDALALAANRAAAEGRFVRHDSLETSNSDVSPIEILASASEEGDESGPPNLSPRPSLVPDDSRLSQATTTSPPTARISEVHEAELADESRKSVGFFLPTSFQDPYSSEWDYSDYDSAMEDDPIIAAANAEALENDDDGFYGSEFGFYARPGSGGDPNAEPSEAVLGGYFGPKNWGEIKRQRSTREPNLTPITERSEYSTRNSFMNLQDMERGAPSPGLVALARMSSGWDDMNLETLRKLRRGAFGGSSGSLRSAKDGSSPVHSSPIAGRSDPRALWSSPISREIRGVSGDDDEEDERYDDFHGGDYINDDYGEGLEGDWEDASETSSDYDDEDEDPIHNTGWNQSAPDSPTIRAQLQSHQDSPSPTKLSSPAFSGGLTDSTIPTAPTTITSSVPPSPQLLQPPSRPLSMSNASQPTSPTKHSRSGSDSVAYVRERDEERGEVRWFLERRRTNEEGIESLVNRTLVEGGRI